MNNTQKIKEWAEKSGLRNQFIAKKFGISPEYWSMIKSGRLPGKGLRTRIEELTGGEIRAEDWEASNNAESSN